MHKKIIIDLGRLLRIEPQKIRSKMRLKEDLNMDNLDKMEILMDIELMYGIEIEDEYIDNFITVKDLYGFLKNIKKTIK